MSSNLVGDVRYAVRTLTKQPMIAGAAVLALALGVGANTAIFSAVNAVLIESLPFPEPNRLAVLWENNAEQGKEREGVSAATFLDWRRESQSFSGMGAWMYWGYALTGDGEPQHVTAPRVSPSLFNTLGIGAALGRTFESTEEALGQDRVVVLSHEFWQRRYAGAPDVVGQQLVLDGIPHIVVGVMPAGFRFPDDDPVPMWTPLAFTREEESARRRRSFNVIARLEPGITFEQAESELAAIAQGISQQYPESNAGWGVTILPATNLLFEDNRHLLILLGAVGFVLLIACANVGSLLLARAVNRRREFAVRTALGAGQGSIVRQLLVESAVLTLAGTVAGVGLAIWALDLIMAAYPEAIPSWNAVTLDLAVLAFVGGVAAVTTILAGVIPALQASRLSVNELLKESADKTSAGGRARRLRSALVTSEIAIAVVLLAGAGLMINSFLRLQRVNPGFNADNLLAVDIFLVDTRYPDARQQIDFLTALVERVQAVPGVLAAGTVSALPLNQSGGADFDLPITIEGRPSVERGREPEVDFRVASEGYLRVMGIPLIQGRGFTDEDRADAPRVALINRTTQRRHFPDVNPVGQRIAIPWGGSREIVGVVDDVRHRGLDAEARPEMYVPMRQEAFGAISLVVRTTGDPLPMAESIKAEIYQLDALQPVFQVSTMRELVSDSVATRRFSMLLLALFAGLATVLAAIGVHALVSYTVTQRTREIGIRVALGAARGDVVRMVVRHGLLLAAVGVAIGVVVALGVTRLLGSLLFEVEANDPLTLSAVAASFIAIALTASWLPARHAARVDPMEALRYE